MTATDVETALLAAVRANPDEDAPRLVYADWLAGAGRELEAIMQRIIAQPGRDEWRLDYAAELERTAGEAECGCDDGSQDTGGFTPWGEPISARCNICDGTSRVSDGRAELAAFVRVQVELAKPILCNKCDATGKHKRGYCNAFMYGCDEFGDDDCSHKNEIISCTECTPKVALLRRRERELWPAVRGAFEGEGVNLWCGRWPGSNTATPAVLVSRGLPAVVRCNLAEWMGGECECKTNGACGDPYDMSTCRHCPSHSPCSKCRYCHGTGRIPGIGPRLAQRWPIERVEVTDKGPMGSTEQPGKWTWFADRPDEIAIEDGHGLPIEIFSRLAKGSWSRGKISLIYGTIELASSALSDALIAWARSQPIEEGRS